MTTTVATLTSTASTTPVCIGGVPTRGSRPPSPIGTVVGWPAAGSLHTSLAT